MQSSGSDEPKSEAAVGNSPAKAGSGLGLRGIATWRVPVAISMILAASVVAAILFYTHGALLYGGDIPGFYAPSRLLEQPSPSGLVFLLAVALSLGNYYVGFYLGTFISITLTALGAYVFAKTLFAGHFGERALVVISASTAWLYMLNPSSLTDTFKIFFLNFAVENAAFFLFLAELIRILRSAKRGLHASMKDVIVAGLSLGVSAGLFPNNLRVILLGVLLWVYGGVIVVAFATGSPSRSLLLARIVRPLPMASVAVLAGASYSIIPMLSNLQGLSAVIAGASKSFGPIFFQGSYNQILNVVRMLGLWSLDEGYVPYYTLYFNNPLVVFATFLWPVLSFGAIVLVTKRRLRPATVAIGLVMLAVIGWDKAGNPPLGEIYSALTSSFPVAQSVFPTFFLTRELLSKLYSVMAALSIFCLVTRLPRWLPKLKPTGAWQGLLLKSLVLMSLVLLLLTPAIPVFNGQMEGLYFRPDQKGYWIPQAYTDMRTYLVSHDGYALLLPGITTYFMTEWGFQGSNAFYLDYFSPARVFVPDSLGSYSYSVKNSTALYSNLTNPIMPDESTAQHFNMTYDIGSISGATSVEVSDLNVTFVTSNSSSVELYLPFNGSQDFSNFDYMILHVDSSDQGLLSSMITNGTIWIGMASQAAVGWYVLGSSPNSLVKTLNDGSFSIELLVGHPDQPFPLSEYDPSHVTGLYLQLFGLKPNTEITAKLPELLGIVGYTINPGWEGLIHSHGINYIMVDRSIDSGASIQADYLNAITQTLLSNGYVGVVVDDGNLTLYKILF